jgi:excisionase family DNA binding protein
MVGVTITATDSATQVTLHDVESLATRLGVSVRYVRRLVEERRVPYFKIGRHLRFDADEVEAWLADTRVEPVTFDRRLGRRR